MRPHALLGLFTALSMVVVGCSGDGVGPDEVGPQGLEVGTFSAALSGAQAAQLAGVASSRSGTTEPGHALQFTTTSGQSMSIGTPLGARPAPGTYPIVALEDVTDVGSDVEYGAIVQFAPNVFGSVSGTLTISSSSDDQVSGSFSFSATNELVAGSTLSVEGSFVASHLTL